MMALGIVTRPIRVGGKLPEDGGNLEEANARATTSSVITVLETGREVDLESAEIVESLTAVEHPMVETLRVMTTTECLKSSAAQWARDYLVPCLISDGKVSTQTTTFTRGRTEVTENRIVPREERHTDAEKVEAEYAAPLVFLPPLDTTYPRRSAHSTDKTYSCCHFNVCDEAGECCVHRHCSLPEAYGSLCLTRSVRFFCMGLSKQSVHSGKTRRWWRG